MNDDLIKRSDAIEQLNEAISICPPCMKGTGIYRTSALEEAIDIINQIPFADRPQGRWVEDYNNTYSRRRMKCSVCGKFSGIGGIKSNQLKPFCPNCGAKMDVECKENE
jgi:hypothetical protein